MAAIDLPERSPGPDAADAGPEGGPSARLRFLFSGSGGEYFRIWIVNILLSILTIGIYSAWAKVRNKQYFYGSTSLEGAGFEYTANPVNILKGRILVVGVLGIYQLLSTFAPGMAGLLGIGFLLLFPWVVIQALAFNARYSAYRGLRFHFDGRYPEAFRFYVLWTVIAIFTAGLGYPYAVYLRKRFMLERSRYGQTTFSSGAKAGYFYVVYLIAGVAFIGLLIGAMVIGGGLAAVAGLFNAPEAGDTANGPAQAQAAVFGTFVFSVFLFTLFLGVAVVVQTTLTNHIWQNAKLGSLQFDMQMSPLRVLWIQLSNAVCIIATAGLFIPWAKVRIVRYRLACFSLLAAESLDNFLASERELITATGEEFGEVLDLDLGL
jgi:uncharacterized membrane protein YjgN (DUF898 family)